ncbi:unnamed protein product [Vicia faba]|uniref:Uncharacterized protein n=1 Tax=Vicia faba TaxID=3906 RepID=A0AAV0YVV6_VICFA|nr:unnamed protein product [Vicia faba]
MGVEGQNKKVSSSSSRTRRRPFAFFVLRRDFKPPCSLSSFRFFIRRAQLSSTISLNLSVSTSEAAHHRHFLAAVRHFLGLPPLRSPAAMALAFSSNNIMSPSNFSGGAQPSPPRLFSPLNLTSPLLRTKLRLRPHLFESVPLLFFDDEDEQSGAANIDRKCRSDAPRCCS